MSRRERRQKGEPTLSHEQLDQFARTLLCPTDRMMDELERELREFGYSTTRGEKYCYAPGDVPLMLVAHVDTVHDRMPVGLSLDRTWTNLKASTNTGLGADDRCGVWGVREILRRGLRPHVLYTDEEESGGGGAREAAQSFQPGNVRLLVEMDRMNDDDMVFYSCESGESRKYVGQYGFKEAIGSFTDISILMPAWDVSGVNVSIGYYDQHTNRESCNLRVMLRNVNRVGRMVHNPPKSVIAYDPVTYSNSYWKDDRDDWDGYRGLSSNQYQSQARTSARLSDDIDNYMRHCGYALVNGVWQKDPKSGRNPLASHTILDAEEAVQMMQDDGLTYAEMKAKVDAGEIYVVGGLDRAIQEYPLPHQSGTRRQTDNYCGYCQQADGEDSYIKCLECGRGYT